MKRLAMIPRDGAELKSLGAAVVATTAMIASVGGLAGCSRNATSQMTADGTIELTQVDVAPYVAGRVVSVRVDEGGSVHRGDTLVVLAQSALPADISQRQAR